MPCRYINGNTSAIFGDLRYGEFDSVVHLAARVIDFITDYNRRARPSRWTYDGRPLKVA